MGGAFRLVARIGGREYRAAVRTEAVLGSGPDCDLVLPDPTVSRRHARVQPQAGALLVEDLGSRNGTRVDGARIETPAVAGPGALLCLGEVELRVEAVAEGDLAAAVGADQDPPPPARGTAAGRAEPTLVSAGLTRFCVRELEPLLRELGRHGTHQAYGARVLTALAAAEPDTGFRLLGPDDAVLARSGPPGPASIRLQRDALVLEVCGADAPTPALRTLAQLGLSLLAAARATAAVVEPSAVAAPAPARDAVAPSTANPALREIYWQASRVAPSRLNVLLTGESGTGKELLARYLHDASGEPADRYLVLNCAALPSDLLDAELFGIEGGVATGVSARPGRFELAHGGTLFLDEVGDMSLDTQARILRVLQEREVYRVGSHRPRPADVRVVSATNRDLEAMVRDGRFRLDLFHRIADWRAGLPALRERPEDIANLAAQFLAQSMATRGLRSGGISQGAVDALCRYGWPGNVRELEREMARVALFVEDAEVVTSTLLKPEILAAEGAAVQPRQGLAAELEREERRIIARALSACAGQVAQAAERLGVSKSTLYRRLQQLGLDSGTR